MLKKLEQNSLNITCDLEQDKKVMTESQINWGI